MARIRVCRNCGWCKTVRRSDGKDYYHCPQCTAVTHVENDFTGADRWTYWLIGLTVTIGAVLGVCGCGLFLCMAPMLHRRR
jgi:hypothetical protein